MLKRIQVLVAVCFRQADSDLNGCVAVSRAIDTTVSYDGSWLMRVHRSL